MAVLLCRCVGVLLCWCDVLMSGALLCCCLGVLCWCGVVGCCVVRLCGGLWCFAVVWWLGVLCGGLVWSCVVCWRGVLCGCVLCFVRWCVGAFRGVVNFEWCLGVVVCVVC